MDQWAHFAARLRELRETAGLTQQQLAERSGLTLQGLGQLERSRRQPSWETVCRLAAALNVECMAFTQPSAEEAPTKRAGRPRKATAPSAAEQGAAEPKAKPKKKGKQ